MGMYSSFSYEELEVKNWDKLVNAFDIFADYLKRNGKYYGETFDKNTLLNFENKTISFESWEEIKLISYWYDDYLLFFELIAPFIEGSVYFDFESKDETGSITFKNGECIIETGVMTYHEWKPLDNIEKKEIDEQLNKAFLLNKLERE